MCAGHILPPGGKICSLYVPRFRSAHLSSRGTISRRLQQACPPPPPPPLTHLMYLRMLISFDKDRGRSRKRHSRRRTKRWSVYQWCGISDTGKSLTSSNTDRHTAHHTQTNTQSQLLPACQGLSTQPPGPGATGQANQGQYISHPKKQWGEIGLLAVTQRIHSPGPPQGGSSPYRTICSNTSVGG